MALATPAKPAVSVRILLGEDGDLVWPQPSHLHKVTHDGIRLLGVAGPIIEDVAIGWIAPEQAGAGERPEKQHLALESVWQRQPPPWGCQRCR